MTPQEIHDGLIARGVPLNPPASEDAVNALSAAMGAAIYPPYLAILQRFDGFSGDFRDAKSGISMCASNAALAYYQDPGRDPGAGAPIGDLFIPMPLAGGMEICADLTGADPRVSLFRLGADPVGGDIIDFYSKFLSDGFG